MTESALNKAALVEVDPRGLPGLPCGSNLMDNIQSPQFQVDGSRNGNFSSVSATVMQEDFTNNTADFRMQVHSENAIIRCNMYVIPMGREVIFYITVGDLSSPAPGISSPALRWRSRNQEPEPEQSDTSESAVADASVQYPSEQPHLPGPLQPQKLLPAHRKTSSERYRQPHLPMKTKIRGSTGPGRVRRLRQQGERYFHRSGAGQQHRQSHRLVGHRRHYRRSHRRRLRVVLLLLPEERSKGRCGQ